MQNHPMSRRFVVCSWCSLLGTRAPRRDRGFGRVSVQERSTVRQGHFALCSRGVVYRIPSLENDCKFVVLTRRFHARKE